ncbi:triose-phosphate isomerase [Candidatus Liberibacter americanus]|uniref:Triosephosphate isomerase n=1 Tax=Candidatus Liberibacter americanus str. Sao Paulo TaxID=1261131 RepID=U6B528_9HYPH|nr:triose-phosphate isomerase [Candidatus Liberibacter americanus]AHA28174.1 Triosephosphate isomerase [Candidatus Liberibacter americanus str. Sao Paulo]EMS35848.1 triosephosphate isomerase protein [Candidatus Liberibacter americanus PW_SP]
MRVGIRPLIVGNWKMHGLCSSLEKIEKIAEHTNVKDCRVDVAICPPATLIYPSSRLCVGSTLMIGAQDCHMYQSGSYTGDISANMLADSGASFVILGHSERRIGHKETSQIIQSKVKAACEAGLIPIVCIGETDDEYRCGRTIDILQKQLEFSLPNILKAYNLVIAYEPVWAIGTGLLPSASDLEKVHSFIRCFLSDRFPDDGHNIRILYGGSVSVSNVKEFLHVDNIDGVLVGGASLQHEVFLTIVDFFERVYIDSYL